MVRGDSAIASIGVGFIRARVLCVCTCIHIYTREKRRKARARARAHVRAGGRTCAYIRACVSACVRAPMTQNVDESGRSRSEDREKPKSNRTLDDSFDEFKAASSPSR